MSQTIFIKNLEGKTQKINVNIRNDTLSTLISKYADKAGQKSQTIQLIFNGKKLDNKQEDLNKKLYDCDLKDKSIVFSVLRLKGGKTMNITFEDADRKSHVISIDDNKTVYQLKQKIYNDVTKTLEISSMDLRYAGVQLQNDKKLSYYKIVEADGILKIVQQKCGLGKIAGIIVAYQQSDIFAMDDIGARMPCGHVVGTEGMTGFIRSLIDNHVYQILCPAFKPNGSPCQAQWSFDICKKVGVFTQAQEQAFSQGLSINWIKRNASQCPQCSHRIIKGDLNSNRVRCPNCDYGDFCYDCLQPWKNSGFLTCGNSQCNYLVKILQECPFDIPLKLKQNGKQKNYMLPRYRACPQDKTMITHISGCKHMNCPKCNKQFCWVCLQRRVNGSFPCGSYNNYCGTVAQPQSFK